jgi:hypothetical protein
MGHQEGAGEARRAHIKVELQFNLEFQSLTESNSKSRTTSVSN